MKAHDLRAALAEISAGEVMTAEEDAAAFPRLASFNAGAIYVGRFAGETPWERHAEADELLYVLEGAVDITVLTDPSPTQVRISAGSVFVVPRGLWHRQHARPSVTLLAATPDTSEISVADDPRR
jgi:mannose-6-phosphate isomerase-like protein (cupin superfamily)